MKGILKKGNKAWIPLLYVAALALLLVYGAAPRTLTATDGESYAVTVTYDASARIPAGSTLEASELSGERYEDYYARAVSETGGFARMRAFDLRCVAPDGSEIEPCAPVKVSFRLAGSHEAAERARVLHFVDEGGVVAPPLPAAGAASDGYYTLDFETDSFSVYATLEGVIRRTLTASDNRTYQVTVDYDDAAGIPDDAELIVNEIRAGGADYEEYVAKAAEQLGQTPESVSFARAFDITLRNPLTGEEYQPDKDVQVSIELLNDDLNRYDSVDVVHIHGEDDGLAELMACEINGEAVEFAADGFSVYVLIGSDAAPRCTYVFFVPGDADYTEYSFTDGDGKTVYSQTIKTGDRLIVPQMVSTDETKVFAGWYEGEIVDGKTQLEAQPYDFDNIIITEDSEIHLYAVYKEYAYVTFHGQYDSASGEFPIVYTRRAELTEGSASVKIDDISATYNSVDDTKRAFWSWSRERISTPGASGDPDKLVTPDLEGCITVTGSVDLYPVYKNINWLIFYAAQSGLSAAYVPPVSYFEGDPVSMPLPPTSREGYTFKGWYAGTLTSAKEPDADGKETTVETVHYGGQVTDENGYLAPTAEDSETYYISGGSLHLRADTTLYAKWEADYHIVYWKQKTTETPETETKTYDYAETVTKTADIGATVFVADEDKADNRYPGYEFGHCDSEKTIQNTKELTVLNVYYDLTPDYTPDEGPHTLTFADSVSGEGASGTLPTEAELAYGAALSGNAPANPVSGRTSDSGKALYAFTRWYMDADCTIEADVAAMTMPDHDLTLYAGWEPVKYRVQIDPNYGALYAYDDDGKLQGSGATYFNNTYDAEPIGEYTHVKRDYAKSSSGTWFYVNHDLAYGGADRFTYYTQNPAEATEDTAFEYAPGAYTYAGWYEVYLDENGAEIGEAKTPYDFSQRTDHPTKLRLHWKKNGVYFLAYDAQNGALNGTMEDGETQSVLLSDIYADRAEITLTRSAIAPDGYSFAGWRLRGDDNGRVYAPGETFVLRADDAVRVSGKEIVTLEAVYVRLSVARIVYDANGGAVGGTVDSGRIPGGTDGEATPVAGTVDAAANTVTVSGLDNNSKFTLSNGAGFTKDGFELAGWSHERVYDPADADAKLYELGGTYGVDALEPTTLYAVWRTTVTYHLNPPEEGAADWGGEWDTEIYTKNPDDTYSQTVYLKNTVSEPSRIPEYTGENGLMYRYWTTEADNGDAGYNFAQRVTAPLDLYAYWSEPQTITVHAVDASAETLVEKTDWATNPISVGTSETVLSAASHVTAPDGYAFAFAAAATGMESISDRNAVSAVKYDGVTKSVRVRYGDDTDFTALESGHDIYFVYYNEKPLNVSYKSMGPDGELKPVTGLSGSVVTATDALGGDAYDAAQLAPSALYGYSHYAFAIGDADAETANGLRMMTNAVAFGEDSPPTLYVRNGWRGFEYSTDNAAWVNCGYAPTLYVVYYKQIPTVVMFHEKTVGSADVMATEFVYNYVVTETETVLRKAGDAWETVGALSTRTVYDTTASGTPYALKNGEANSAILFYSETPEETDGSGVTRKVVTAQSVTITQTPNPDFTTDIDGTPQESEPFRYVYAADGSGGTRSVTFTNTHKAMTVEVHVALVANDGGDGGIIRQDSLRSDTAENYRFAVELGKSGKPLEKLSSAAIFTGDATRYAFGAVMYGSGADADGEAVSVAGMDVASVAYERIGEGDVYELVLKDGAGNSLGRLGRNALYFLYYPMPQIRYVKENADGTLTDISGSISGSITYGHAALTMNGQTVAQKQSFAIPMTGFVISQSGNNFRMPAILDDGAFEHYLSYAKIGAGNGDAERISDLDGVSEGRYMRLEVRDNTLRYSFDGATWTPLPLSGTPTVYAIYGARGYDLQISKTTAKSDDNALFANASFTVTLTSPAITKGSYEVEGADGAAVPATPANGDTPGSIVLTVKDGTKVKIKGLGRDVYTLVESGNENYTLTAKTGRILGNSTDDITVTNNSEISLTLDAETKVDLTNTPKELCKIGDNVFYTLQDALDYVEENIADYTATIEMLTGYLMPPDDTLTVPEGFNITLTTAESFVPDSAGGDSDSGTLAVIRRGEALADAPLFVNKGSLTFGNLIVDGALVASTAPLIQSAGALTIGAGATIRNALSSGNGGAIYATAGDIAVNSGVLTGNRAASGGALYYAGSGRITLSETGKVEVNAATTGDGGAIYAEGGSIQVTGTASVEGNKAENGNGGAIYARNAVIGMEQSGVMKGNTARNGGAVYALTGTITLEETEGVSQPPRVADNVATDGDGGAMWLGSGSVTVSGGALLGNKADSGKGGAVYANGATVSLSGTGEAKSNTAGDGGAIYANTGAVTLTGGVLEDNTAVTGDGGAVYANAGAVEVSGGKVTGNATTVGDGGAIYAKSGNVTLSGSEADVSGNCAGRDGGALYAGSGAVTMSMSAPFVLTQNTAGRNGGAFYLDSGSVALNATAMTNNSAVNGAALFVASGRAAFDGGSYTNNVASEGGAVGVGSASARLTFQNDVQIKDNTLGADGPKSNVYLNQDSDDILNMTGLGANAAIGVYVSDSMTDRRDVPGARFASYTTDANVSKITNDRYDFNIQQDTAAKKLFWGKAIKVEVRYLASYQTETPPTVNSELKYTNNQYYPEFGSAAISELAAELYAKYNSSNIKLVSDATYGGAYLEGASWFGDYLTRLVWDSAAAAWMVDKRDGTVQPLADKRIVIYYAQPAYISIENNTDMPLDISTLTVNGLPVVNSVSVAGYGMVFAKNGYIQTGLLPVTADDLKLAVGTSINLLIPGGQNMAYALNGQFTTDEGKTVKLRRTGLAETELTANEVKNGFLLTGTTLNSPANYEIIFGENRDVCKITVDGEELLFGKISDAVKYVKDNQASNGKRGVIEMLTDYLLPLSDKVTIPKGFDITLTTARDGKYHYVGERATISRNGDNPGSMIATEVGDVNSSLTLTNLIFDGKSVQGNSDGGIVSAKFFKVTVDRVDFFNIYANQGGALYVDDYNNSAKGKANSIVEVTNCTFRNCNSTKFDGSRLGGGAIHAFSDTFNMSNCTFEKCDGGDQAGAVFHRVDSNYDSWTNISNCKFTNCSAWAAGALELDSKYIVVKDCSFEHCVATRRNGGGFNIYALNSAGPAAQCEVRVSNCTFNDCHATNTTSNNCNGGGLRSTATHNIVENCTFTNTSSQYGGGISFSNTNAAEAEVYGCAFDDCSASSYGGGIYCLAKTLAIGDYVDENDDARHTIIQNCSTPGQGGGVFHNKGGDDTFLTITNATIQNNVSSNSTGGGVHTVARSVTITGSDISKNTSKGVGGGLYSSARNLTITDSAISKNTSGGNGGGVWFDGANDTERSNMTLTVRGCTLDGNAANNGDGGGIYTLAKVVEIGAYTATEGDAPKPTTISNCIASGSGGGVYQSRNVAESRLVIEGSSITGCVANDSATNSVEHGGGGVFTNARTVTVKDSDISGNRAVRNGGGIISCSSDYDRYLIIDHSTLKNNTSGNQGGGVYSRSQLTLRNGVEITENRLSNTTATNAAGVFIENNRTLFIGPEGAEAGFTDNVIVRDNRTANGAASDLRLWEDKNENKNTSVYVYCHLSGEIRVINAKKAGTWFGSSGIYKPDGFSDNDSVFKADVGTLHGIIDRMDDSGTKIIWAGPPIAKITDGDGNLLYMKANASDPAIFDRLYQGNENDYNTKGAFNMLNSDAPELYRANGELYAGSSYYVKMLVERFETDTDINVMYVEGRTITFTTAGRSDTDGYPYEGRAGSRATVIRGSSVSRTLINSAGNLTFKSVIVDGGSANGITPTGSTRILYVKNANCRVTLGDNATLQNARVKADTDGGGVYVYSGSLEINGGIIRNCSARNGGAVYSYGGQEVALKAGNISQCEATGKGGGVYLNSGSFYMSGGTISDGTASEGGGVYVVSNVNIPFHMSGGSIIRNHAATKGGGIAIENTGARLYFSGRVTVSGNTATKDGETVKCNVELDRNTKAVINTNNGGLKAGAYVGVYVPGNRDDEHPENDGTPYKERGGEWDAFGTYANGDNTTTLYGFVNDRNGLKGAKLENKEKNTIYWVRIFGLRVEKKVIAGHAAQPGEDESFDFTVRLTGAATPLNAWQIDSRNENGDYGEMEFYSNGVDMTTADFSLRPDEGVTGVNLSYGLEYRVTENLTAAQAKKYAVMPASATNSQEGHIGDPSADDPYTCVVTFANVLPVCKITDSAGNLLTRSYTVDGVTYDNVPAVYTELTGADGAFAALSGFGRNDLQIQMLIPEYTLTEAATVPGAVRVTLTTAKTSDADFPYRGTNAAVIKRDYDGGSMFAVNGTLTLADITLDGAKASRTSNADGGLVNVAERGNLTILSGATLTDSKTSANGGAAYVASGGTVTMSGGKIQKNESVGNGAGVYLEQGATLNLSGAPDFGGKGTDSRGHIVIGEGNYKTGTLLASTNGGSDKTYTRARQDIYLAEADDSTASLVLKGDLTGDPGSIWVWAENEGHYKMTRPFATSTVTVNDATRKIFRNARTDNDVKIIPGVDVQDYLTGTTGKDTSLVYWTTVRSDLQVSKTVLTGHDVTEAETFGFTVELTGSVGSISAGDINSVYGGMSFASQGVKASAGVSLQSGGSVKGENLPNGLDYTVTETLTTEQARHYVSIPPEPVTGTIGGNSAVTFTNILPVCKITDSGGNQLYRDYTLNGVTYNNVPAVYTELYGVDGAFAALQATAFYKNDNTPYSVSEGVQIQMLIPAYTLMEALTLPSTVSGAVTLTTAKTTDAQFPYRGPNDTATIQRAYDGGSLFAVGGDLTLTNITLDGAKGSYTSNADGGLVNVASNGKLTIQDNATLTNSKTGKNGGAVYVNGGSVTMSGGEVNGNESDNGGAVYVAGGGSVTVSGGEVNSNTSADNGGAVYVANGGSVTMSGGEVDSNKSNGNGGAVYVASGGSVTMSGGDASHYGGKIQKNASDGDGAGVYLAQGSKLYLSGNPDFGGAGMSVNGNYRNETLSGKTNGNEAYAKARQDIYLAEAGSVTASIVLKGDLTGGDGSVWVWAEKSGHYEKQKPFATIETASGSVSDGTYTAFRNARTDDVTDVQASETYLTGTTGADPLRVYWKGTTEVGGGGFGFSFGKVNGFGHTLSGAEFTLYTDAACTQANGAPIQSTDGTVSFTEILPGTYYMKETAAPTGYVSNDNEYIVLIGDDALSNRDPVIFENVTQEQVDAQTTDGVAIFRMDDGKADAVPDIKSRGILNVSEDKRTVILRKVGESGANYIALDGVDFEILRYDLTAVPNASNLSSHSNGVFWAGELEYGKYYLHEKAVPDGYEKLPGGDKWFEITVNAGGVTVTSMNAAP